jgi:hypothetical protein
MPLSMLYSWIGGRLLGTSEWQLRAINIFWGFLGVFSFYWVGRILKISWLPILFAVHPFVWHYMNEARPYAMQLGCSSLLAAGLVYAVTQNSRTLPVLAICLGGLTLCSSSLLGVLPFGVILTAYAFWMWRRKLLPKRNGFLLLLVTFVLLLALGTFYLWTLSKGAGGAKLWKVGGLNLVFSAYELLGFSGLGPPRQALREAATVGFPSLISLMQTHAMGLICLFLIYVAVTLKGACVVFRRESGSGIAITMLYVVVGSFLVVGALSYTQSFPFWGRHLAPTLPFALIAIAVFLASSKITSLVTRVLLLCLLTLSSIQLRYSGHYPKDNYRDAATRAKSALSEYKEVSWYADGPAGIYYRIPSAIIRNQTKLDESVDVVILGTPEIYDADGSIRSDAQRAGLFLEKKLPGILIYSRTGNSQP